MDNENELADTNKLLIKFRGIRERLLGRQVEKTFPVVDLKEYVLEAARQQDIIKEIPKRFNLGELGKELDHMMQLTEQEHGHPEFGNIACVSKDGKLLLSAKPTKGDSTSVYLPHAGQNQAMLGLHTHPVDVPFSDKDLEHLFDQFIGPKHLGALVITPEMKLLAIRSDHSKPIHSHDASNIFYDESYEHTKLRAVAEGKPVQALPHSAAYMYYITRASLALDIILYACPRKENIVSLLN